MKSRWLIAMLACALALGTGACRKRSAQALPPVVILPPAESKPAETPPAPEPAKQPEEKPAEPAKTPELAVPAPRPARSGSRSAAPAKPSQPETTPPTETGPRPAPPKMSPRLSPAEQAVAEKQTSEAILAAEKNMERAQGRTLTAVQADLLEKTRGFLAQAREAIGEGDWLRARTLAEKARALSVELAASFGGN